MKNLFNIEHLNKLYTLPGVKSLRMPTNNQVGSPTSKIVFVLPLSGRYETFLRFLNNYEEVSHNLRYKIITIIHIQF